MKDIMIIHDIVGMKVRHGSPGYETSEVISSVSMDAESIVTLEFESDAFTSMTFDELKVFYAVGLVEYTRAQGFKAFECLIAEKI